MVRRDELIKFINKTIGEKLLEKVKKFDSKANGVQIHGRDEVSKVALGVSASLDFFNEAVATKADFCIFHHGLSLGGDIVNGRINQATQVRLKTIFVNNLTVAGYHAALDIQGEFGNNATIINLLGAEKLDIPYFDGWGWIAEFDKPQDVKELAEKFSKILSHDVFAVYGGKEKVKRIGVCSGGAKPSGGEVFEIVEKEIELHVTGEVAEGGPALTKDIGFNYFAGGHYATEVFGVQELGKKIKEHYKNKLEVEFIDIPNEI